jgi:hypothetical protein
MSEATGKTLLGLKLDQIAAMIADETIQNKGETTLAEKCAVLKNARCALCYRAQG